MRIAHSYGPGVPDAHLFLLRGSRGGAICMHGGTGPFAAGALAAADALHARRGELRAYLAVFARDDRADWAALRGDAAAAAAARITKLR